MKLKIIALILTFLFAHLSAQTSLYIYSNKNVLPDEKLVIQVSGSYLKSQKIHFQIFRIKDPLKFILINLNYPTFSDKEFNLLQDELEIIFEEERFINVYQNWFHKTFEFNGVPQTGTYLIKAASGESTSYTFFTCSKFGITAKRTIDEALIFIADRITSRPIDNIKVELVALDKKSVVLKSNENGIAYGKIGDRPENRKLFVITTYQDSAILHQDFIYSPSDEYNKYLVYSYTNQPVYRPEQKVYFKSILRERKGDELIALKNFQVRVKIIAPDNSTVFDSLINTNSLGTLNGSFEIPVSAPLGSYTLNIEISGMNYPYQFFVEAYKKPEYKVIVSKDKENYNPSDSIKVTVKGEYFFGKPVQTGKVKYYLYRKPLVRYWWEFEPYARFYRSCFIEIIPFYQSELIEEGEGELVEGVFSKILYLEKDIQQNYEYQFVAYLKDESNREVQGSTRFLITKDKIQLTTSPDRYFYHPGQKIIIKVTTTDFSANPKEEKFEVIMQKVHIFDQAEYYEDVDTLKGQTQKDGIGFVSYQTNQEGKFSYKVIVKDKEKIISVRNNFFVGERGFASAGYREGLQIISSKDIYNQYDEIELMLISPVDDVNVFLTLEQSEIYYYDVVKIEGNTKIIKIKSPKKLPAAVYIYAGFYSDNQFFSTMKKIGILREDKKLNVTLIPDKSRYKPGERGKLKVKITDTQGKPVENAEISISTIDESIFSIREETAENIFDYFSKSSIYKVFTVSTEIISYGVSTSQERFQEQSERFKWLGFFSNGKIKGKILDYETGKPIENINIILIKGNQRRVTRTNEDGIFVFTGLPSGIYKILISSEKYENRLISSIKLAKNQLLDAGIIYVLKEEKQFFRYFHDRIYKLEADVVNQAGFTPERKLQLEAPASGDKKFIEPVIRSEFKDAIFWKPDLVTNSKGEVDVDIKYPDNLTSWRNTVRSITIDSKIGESYINTITQKDIIIRVESPRYIHEKDEISLPIIVHNYTKSDKQIRVSVTVENGKLIIKNSERMNQRIIDVSTTQDLKVKANGIEKIYVTVGVDANVDSLKIIAKALVKESFEGRIESDAIKVVIPVEQQGVRYLDVVNFSLSKKSAKYDLNFDAGEDLSNVKVQLKLTPTLLGNLLSSIDELVGYPYGCVEQTMSRFLPSIIVANLIQELKVNVSSKTLNELPEIVKKGLKRLKELQHFDGGWGWWESDQTNPYMTAYVMYGLTLTKEAGYQVPERMFYEGLKSLRKLVSDNSIDERTKTYLLYSLSKAIRFSDSFENDRELAVRKFYSLLKYKNDPFVSSLLLQIAQSYVLEDKISDLKNSLMKSANKEGNIVYWGKNSYSRLINDRIEITSNAIKSLIMIGESNEIIENAVRWLINQKRGNLWFSTKQTATVIYSLVDYLKMTSELESNFDFKILINGKEFYNSKFSEVTDQNELTLEIDKRFLKVGINQIRIEKSGRGKLYCSLIQSRFVEEVQNESYTFQVKRKFYRVYYEKEKDRLVQKLEEVKDTIKVGDRILVELIVKSKQDLEYFMLEDPLIPGFEVLQDPLKQNGYYYHHREFRDKNAAFFMTHFPNGELNFKYLTYAQLPGVYILPPAVSSLMYYPEVRGFSSSKKFVVAE